MPLNRELRAWAEELLEAMSGVCEVLDGGDPAAPYSTSLARQRSLVEDPELTPSARMLAEMRERGESFFGFAQRLSEQHLDWFNGVVLSPESERLFTEEAARSRHRQRAIEAGDDLSFDDYLAHYFAQA